jgi:sugar phosphate isomerase/epimerase
MIRTGASTNAAVSQGARLETVIEGIADHGLDFVEVSMEGPQTRATIESDAERIRQLLDDRGLDCVVHLPWVRMEVGSPFAEVRDAWLEVLEQNIQTASRLGAEKGVVHGTNTERDYPGKADHVYEALDALQEMGEKYDLEVCAENVSAPPMRIEEFPALFEHTAVSMTLDTGHASVEGQDSASLAAFVSRHADRISHFHLHDNAGDSDDHLPLGMGRLDFEEILAPLRDTDWEGTLALETVSDPESDILSFNKRRLDAVI